MMPEKRKTILHDPKLLSAVLIIIALMFSLPYVSGVTKVQASTLQQSPDPTPQSAGNATKQIYTLYIPVIYNPISTKVVLPGIAVNLPLGWRPVEAVNVPITATNELQDTAVTRLVDPYQEYFIDLSVDWYSVPSPATDPVGTFQMKPLTGYEERLIQLPSGQPVQVLKAKVPYGTKTTLLAQAAFRSAQASYSIRYYGKALDQNGWGIFDQMISSARLGNLPTAKSNAHKGSPEASVSLETTTATGSVAYDRAAAVNYANTFVNLFDNSDDCYLWYNGNMLLCYYKEGYWGVDGAHFVNRALKAGGLPLPGVPDPVAKSSGPLRDWLLAHGGQEVGSASELQPGDVIFFGRNGCWGWEGVVASVDAQGPKLHLHSRISNGITYNWANARYTQVTYNNCGATNRYSFMHINSTQEQAGPLVSQSLTHTPGTPFAGQPVQTSFRVCNYGGSAFDTNELYVQSSAPGSNFPAVDPPSLASGNPGGCYDYTQLATAFPEAGWYTIRAGYVSNGAFQVLDTVSGETNEQTFYVVPADAIKLQGEMLVTPEIVQQGDTATVKFVVNNTSSVTLSDNFRVRIYNESYPANGSLVDEFPESGEISLAPGESYTYENQLTLDTPGIYWIVGEHSAGGAWLPVYGDSIKPLRVRYPMPGKPKLAKGMPPYIALAGEPVNPHPKMGNFVHKHTDLVIPMPGLPFDVTRYYNHIDAADIAGPFGYGSSWSFGWKVNWRDDKTAVLVYPDGRETYLVAQLDPQDPFNLAGEYVGELAETQTLERLADGTGVLKGNDQLLYTFDAQGNLTLVANAAGQGFSLSRDSAGLLQKITHTSGAAFSIENTNGFITAITAADGYRLTYTYSADGNLASAVSTAGEAMTYEYDGQHRILSIQDALKQSFVRNTYDSQNRIAGQVDAAGVQSRFDYPAADTGVFYDQAGKPARYAFDDDYRVVREENALGAVTTYAYDQDFNRIQKTDPLGNTWRWAYDDHARVISSTNPLGATWLYRYDERGNLLLEQDPLGNQKQYAYDAQNNRIRETDAEGHVSTYEYDGRGLRVKSVGPLQETTHYEYNEKGLPVKIIDALGGITTFAYDEYGNRTRYTDALGHRTYATYNAAGWMLTATDALGNVTTFEHDQNGNLIAETDALQHRCTFEYDAQDHLVAYSDFAGRLWKRAYDELGRLVQEEDPLGGVIRYTYDAADHRLTKQDLRGGTWRYAYDLNGRLVSETDPLGNLTRYEYDAAGQRIKVDRPCPSCMGGRATELTQYDLAGHVVATTDGRGQTTRYEYDRNGKPVKKTDALGHTTQYVYNERGDLVQIIDALGRITQRQYNALGWLLVETDRLGFSTTHTYDAVGHLLTSQDQRGYQYQRSYDLAGRMVEETDPLGNSTRYEYDALGNPVRKVDALGRVTEFSYNANSQLIRQVNPLGYVTAFAYDLLGRPVQLTDALDGVTTYTYNPAGDLLSLTDPAKHTRRFAYDLLGHQVQATDANGNVTTYIYDAAGDPVRVTDALGGVTTFGYDANHNLIARTDALGYTTTFAYDALNRRVSLTDPLGSLSQQVYDALGNVTQVIDANGHATSYGYDAEQQPTTITDALGHTTHLVYDPAGNMVKRIDRNNHATTYQYDPLNRVKAQINALNASARTEYDAVGNPVRQVNFRGFATTFEYDANNNPVRKVDPLNGQTLFGYDPLDRLTGVTDANGHTRQSTYDPVGNILSITLPEGQTSSFTYDGEHNLLSTTNAKGYVTRYFYDALNRQVKSIDPLDHVWETKYNALGRVVREVDAERNATGYLYDPLGRLTGVMDALNYTTAYQYDPVGNLLSETNANGKSVQYAYDPLNRMVQETNPLGKTWQYTYDPEGNLVRQVDARGQEIQHTFDALDQLVAIHYPKPQFDVSYSYDANGNLVQMHDPLGETQLTYDALDRLTSQTDPFGRVTRKAYDPVSNLVGLTYPEGDQVSYTYNANDWLVQMRDPRGGVTSYEYDPDGLSLQAAFPNGTWTERAYDPANRLVKIFNGTNYNAGVVTSYDYTLDAVGNRLQTVERYTSGQMRSIVKNYQYNARYELTQAVEAYDGPPAYTVTTAYTYDPAGNRLKMVSDRQLGPSLPQPQVVDYTYDAANHLLSAGQTTYGYDDNGNRIVKLLPGKTGALDKVEAYQYDFENRMTQYDRVQAQSQHIEQRVYNQYDGLGRRLVKGTQESEGVTKWTQYMLDGLGYDPLAEYPQTGKPRVAQLYRGADNQLVSIEEIQGSGAGTQYWFASDGLNSVSATTKQSGQSAHEYFYDPYGQLIDENGHWEDSSSWTGPHNHYLLSGKEWDEESRLYYFGARYYDPEAGIWLTQDPYRGQVNSPMTRHRSLYVRNNPVNRIDPLGYFDFQTGAVEWGDTWESIAAQWGTDVNTLKQLNAWIKTPKVGDYVQLPECRSAECQLQLGIAEVRIGGVRGTDCGERIIQRQKAYQQWYMERESWRNQLRQLGISFDSNMSIDELKGLKAAYEIELARKAASYINTAPNLSGCGITMCCQSPYSTAYQQPQSSAFADWWGNFSTTYDYAEPWIGLPGTELIQVQGYFNSSGTYVKSYVRTVPGGKAFSPLSNGLTLVGVGLSVPSQLIEDANRTDLDGYDKAARASLNLSGTAATTAGAIWIGTGAVGVIGSAAAAISAPAWVPVAVGAVAVVGIAYGANWLWNDVLKTPTFELFGVN